MEINSYKDNNYDDAIYGNSNFGSSIKGEDFGNFVFELKSNNNSDSFNFVTKNYFQNSDPKFNNLFTIKSDGKVGINTKNPSEELEINGNLRICNQTPSNTSIKFLDANNVIQHQLVLKDNYITFQNTNTEVLSISNTNNIGIKTNDPTCSLDINDNKIRIRNSCLGYDSSNKIYLWKKTNLEKI